jgi:hypothetical protein
MNKMASFETLRRKQDGLRKQLSAAMQEKRIIDQRIEKLLDQINQKQKQMMDIITEAT